MVEAKVLAQGSVVSFEGDTEQVPCGGGEREADGAAVLQ